MQRCFSVLQILVLSGRPAQQEQRDCADEQHTDDQADQCCRRAEPGQKENDQPDRSGAGNPEYDAEKAVNTFDGLLTNTG